MNVFVCGRICEFQHSLNPCDLIKEKSITVVNTWLYVRSASSELYIFTNDCKQEFDVRVDQTKYTNGTISA